MEDKKIQIFDEFLTFDSYEELQLELRHLEDLLDKERKCRLLCQSTCEILREYIDNLEIKVMRLEKALDKACEQIAGLTGSCPHDVHEAELDYCIDCQTEGAECWKEWCMSDE